MIVEFGKEDPPEATTTIRTTMLETESVPFGTNIAGGITVIWVSLSIWKESAEIADRRVPFKVAVKSTLVAVLKLVPTMRKAVPATNVVIGVPLTSVIPVIVGWQLTVHAIAPVTNGTS
jgi:hypothetical protein